MLRNRFVATLLALAVLLCALVFSASAEDALCEISVTLLGSGSVSMNDASYYDNFTQYVAVGSSVTLSATADEDFEFLYWVNRETERIVSRDANYTFSVATYAKYQAVFDESESSAQANGMHTVVYLTEGENIIYSQPVPIDDSSYIDEVGTTGMFVSGKKWIGWDKTAQEVSETSGRVFVRPIYSTDVYFDVTSILNGVTTTQSALYRSTMTLTAPPRMNDGRVFSYWLAHAKDDNSVDEIASFYATYSFIVTMDVTLEAVYDTSFEQGISARVSGDFPTFNETSVTIFAEHSVTQDYTILQHGMLLTKDLQIGSFPDTFVINPNEPKIIKGTANNTLLAGTYSLTINNWTPQDAGSYTYYPQIFARAYVIAQDRNGVTHTVYSAIYCVDYKQQTGVIGGDDINDPFG